MIRRKVSLLLAILMVISTMTVGLMPVTAGSDNGITTDLSAHYMKDEYEEIRKLKQKDQTDPDNNEPQQIGRESLYTKTIDNGDGTKTLEVYGEPVRYITKDGSVKDISLTPVRDGAGFRTGDHRLSISFPEKAEDGINLNTGEHVITATPVTENGTAVKTESALLSDTDAIVYRTDPKTSYEYSITYSGYKENIVVSEYTGQTDFLFRLETDGLLLSSSEGDPSRGAGLELKDTDGKTVARISDIIVFSSDNRNNTFGEISYETVTEGCEYILRISLPAAYLSDPETHYPIYIDPTITVAYDANNNSTWNDIEDITVNQNQAADPPTSGTLYVGKAGADYGAMRSVMRFPELELYGIIPGNITSATVKVRDLMCYGFTLQVDCYGYGGTLPTGSFTTANMTWSAVYNTMQYYESSNVYRSTNNISYSNGSQNTPAFWYEFNILPIVQEWAQGRNSGTLAKTDQAIVFKATDSYEQSTSTQYVCFGSFDRNSHKPYCTIIYYEDNVYDSFYDLTSPYFINSLDHLGYNFGEQVPIYKDDGLQLRSNCYGYSIRAFYTLESFPDENKYQLQSGDVYEYYKQQPGEFADKTNGLQLYTVDNALWQTLYNRTDLDNTFLYLLSQDCSSQNRMFLLKQLIQADAATLGYTVTEYTGSVLPDARSLNGSRLIALVASEDDFHFYMQHSDNTWSHKPGSEHPSNVCLCNNEGSVRLTNETIIDHANDSYYSGGGLMFLIITKNAVVDYPHLRGTYTADISPYGLDCVHTSLSFSEYAGNTFFSAKDIGNLPKQLGYSKIDYLNDVDWFSFSTTASTSYSFYFPSVSFPLEISLFDENRQKLYYASSSGNTVQFSFLLSSSTKYFLRVNSSGQIAHENSRMYSFSITN